MSDPLFGPGIRLDGPWVAHFTAASNAGFWRTARGLPRLAGFAVRLAWSADRWALVGAGIAQVVQAVMGAVGLLAVNQVLIELLASGPTPDRVKATLPALLAVACIAGAGSLARAMATAAGGRLAPRVHRLAEQRLLEQAATVELAVLEDASFQRSLAGAQLGARSTEQLATGVLSSFGGLIGLVAVAGVVTSLHPLLMPLLVLAVVPHAWKAVAMARWEFASAMKHLNSTRQKDILADLLTQSGAPAEEIRVHGLATYLLGHYRRLAEMLEAERTRVAKAQAGIGVVADAAGGAARGLAYGALGWLLLSGAVPLAAAGTAVFAITRVTTQLTSLMMQFNSLYKQGLFISDYTATVRQATHHAISSGGRPAPPRPGCIAAREVSFTYPGATEPALQGVDLELRRGEVIALVGANGSGKSTLARLIAGLHQPGSGTITWDGTDVKELDRHSVFSQVAWIGQDFQRWPFTARVNTTLGRPETEADDARLDAAAAFAAADDIVASLPHRWDTLLARDFNGGVNLSGGQWQRLALARAHFRHADVLICDEPTAALDPMTEIETFEKLMALASDGQTILLVTHRLGSIRYADCIYVLDGGRILETGTYNELMSASGLFARMYEAQRHQYAGLGAVRYQAHESRERLR